MARADDALIVIGVALGLALCLMLGTRLISPIRFAQGLGCGLVGLSLVKSVLVIGGATHG